MAETDAPGAAIQSSHLATAQWQSFEMRMRGRRAERCVLHAEAALQAGLIAEAEAALQEARSLDSSTPDLAALRARIAPGPASAADVLDRDVDTFDRDVDSFDTFDRDVDTFDRDVDALDQDIDVFDRNDLRVQPVAAPVRASRRLRPVSALFAALVMAGLAMLFGRALVQRAQPVPPPVATAEPLASPRPPVASVPTPERPESPIVSIAADSPVSTAADSPVSSAADSPVSSAADSPNELPPVDEKTTAPEARPRVPELPPVDEPSSRSTPVQRSTPAAAISAIVPLPVAPAAPPAPTPAPAPINEPPVRDGIVDAFAPAAAAPAVLPPPAPVRNADPVDEAPSVRRVLSGYEAAYSSLDASAAESVWPRVDAKALSRAFDGLESQRVSLGRCDVSVNGASARADCRGTTQWTPKVGGGPHVESRHWTFDLAKADGTWRIVDATVR